MRAPEGPVAAAEMAVASVERADLPIALSLSLPYIVIAKQGFKTAEAILAQRQVICFGAKIASTDFEPCLAMTALYLSPPVRLLLL